MPNKIIFTYILLLLGFQTFAQKPIKLTELKQKGPTRNSDLRVMLDYEKTKDPVTGDIPKEKLLKAKDDTKKVKKSKKSAGTISTVNYSATMASAVSLGWTERGPYADAVGSSNGNTRANSAITAGRVRAILPDLSDATGKTVWAAGVDGGLWKTTDITASTANWVAVNDDQFDNLAITSITQDPTNTNVLYAATGESFMGSAGGSNTNNAVRGVGVFKSIDHGVTWSLLSSTTDVAFSYCTKIICDGNGLVYLATKMFVVGNSITIPLIFGRT